MDDIRNQNQIIRKDARGCFVESLNKLILCFFVLHKVIPQFR